MPFLNLGIFGDGLKNEVEAYQINNLRRKTKEQSTKYLNQGDFLYDREQWKKTINQATTTTDKSAYHLIRGNRSEI
jgi:hypothetical protein